MTTTEQAVLEPKLVNEIKGNFFIPAYQRGYRWKPEHITMLLNDIWENGDNNYCLQPVVVKNTDNNTYELIDGQQRCTSLFLILTYMKRVLPFIELNYTLTYETRPKSAEFLENIDETLANDNIDFFHILNAYKAVDAWFNNPETGDKNLKAINLYKYFGERVKVIWYEVNTDVDSTDLFTRLNIGKIPLTNAELVKALFLSKDSTDITEEKQLEISTSWDLIEKELQDDSLWSFLTNQKPSKYATRIELIFNLMANKEIDEKEELFTFFHFIEEIKKESKVAIWGKIQSYFLTLKEWYQKRDIFHKVGYLVAIGKGMQDIISESENLTKTEFEASLDNEIKKKLNLTKDQILELSYDIGRDKQKIENLLLLHNVETIRLLKNSSEKYPFDKHKSENWSLEHIHAQRSEGLNKKEDQQNWLRLHKASLEDLLQTSKNPNEVSALIQKIEENFENITKVIFDTIFGEVFMCFSENNDHSYVDTVQNMALLSSSNNSALNNSTFDVKRNKILEMDKAGEYIPITTRRVFLKYYTNSRDHQLHYWGEQDRKSYIDSMIGDNGILMKYLKTEPLND
jgi:hypothetical protein